MNRTKVTYTDSRGRQSFTRPVKRPVAVNGKILFRLIGHETPAELRNRQLDLGEIVEQEHTKDKRTARQIGSEHIAEIPNYYDRLIPAEKQWERDWKRRNR